MHLIYISGNNKKRNINHPIVYVSLGKKLKIKKSYHLLNLIPKGNQSINTTDRPISTDQMKAFMGTKVSQI